jgi:hypothetical protein
MSTWPAASLAQIETPAQSKEQAEELAHSKIKLKTKQKKHG